MSKHVINKVELVFFEDDANGEWGVTHKETYSDDNHFNAFWSGIGIWHDVFEHSHEFTHKYFRGDYALNVAGEMAAVAAMLYFAEECGMHTIRTANPNNRWKTWGDVMREENESSIVEAVKYGYPRFGSTLECCIPRQRPTDNSELEYQIAELWNNVKSLRFERQQTSEYEWSDEERYSEEYRKSLSFGKIANAHRWGYKRAERMYPSNDNNRETFYNFIDFWNKFTANNTAEDLAGYYYGIDFRIYKDKEGNISWTAVLPAKGGIKDYRINTNYPYQVEPEEINY